MLNRVDTPMELFTRKLGAALTMEDTVLKMLGDLEDEAHRDDEGRLRR